jgi:sugar phosphate isomerase/epimerase
MDITLGCSLAEYRCRSGDDVRSQESYRRHPVINVENPLYPGYLDQDHSADLEYLRACGQRLILDGPYIDLNLGSPEPQARRLALQKAHEAISFAEQCGAEALVFQSTFLPFIGLEFYERGWVEESMRSWQSLMRSTAAVPVAGDLGVRIALCNTFEFHPEHLLEIVEAVNDPQLELAFDVGHCLVWGRLPVLEWYRRIRERCRVVYLHSNSGRADEHRSIREGVLAERRILEALRPELRDDTVLILKYYDKTGIAADIEAVASMLGAGAGHAAGTPRREEPETARRGAEAEPSAGNTSQ